MLGAREMILIGTERSITSLPKESWETVACDNRGEEKRRIIENSLT
jgi:hypothetical protein